MAIRSAYRSEIKNRIYKERQLAARIYSSWPRRKQCSWLLQLTIMSLLLLLMIAISYAHQGAICHGVKPLNDVLGYKYRGNRCEGFYESNVSGDSLQILSLLNGTIPQDWGRNIVLEISAPSSILEPINIRAVPLSTKPYYRMDGVMRSDLPMSWPIGD